MLAAWSNDRLSVIDAHVPPGGWRAAARRGRSARGEERWSADLPRVAAALHPPRLIPRPQDFRDRPRLRDASARRVRRIALEDLRDRSDAVLLEMMRDRLEKTACRLRIAILSVIAFFVVGLVVLRGVDVKRAVLESGNLTPG